MAPLQRPWGAFRPGSREAALPAIPTPGGGNRRFDAGRRPTFGGRFPLLPARGDADAFNKRLLRDVQQEGRGMLSGTRIDGRFTLRCAILCFRTHIEHVDEAIEVLEAGVARIEAAG